MMIRRTEVAKIEHPFFSERLAFFDDKVRSLLNHDIFPPKGNFIDATSQMMIMKVLNINNKDNDNLGFYGHNQNSGKAQESQGKISAEFPTIEKQSKIHKELEKKFEC